MAVFEPGDPVWVDGFPQAAGSLAIEVFDESGEFDGPLWLAAAHCIGSLSIAAGRDPAIAMAQSRAHGLPGGVHAARVGQVVRSAPPRLESPVEVDAALIQPTANARLEPTTPLGRITREPFAFEQEIGDFTTDVRVHKIGRSTGLTTGTLSCSPEAAELWHSGLGRHIGYRPIYAAIGDEQPFATWGDSGALLVDDQLRPTALVVGVYWSGVPIPEPPPPDTIALCVPIATVLRTLRVHL